MPEASAWRVERIARSQDRASFECGLAELDEFLRKYARQNDEAGLGTTFVSQKPGQVRVLGYYTLRAGTISRDQFPPDETRRLPRYPVPVVHLARLAVDRATQGQRLGEFLLMDALRRALTVSKSVGAYAVEVIAINDNARAFYLKYDFSAVPGDPLHLYIGMKRVAKLFGEK